MNTKILITGAGGFVGKLLIEELRSNAIDVLAIAGPQDKTVDSLILDLTRPESLEGIDLSSINAVIHLAGLAAVGPSFDNPLQYITTNAGIEINLFEACIKQRVRPRFLIISSGSLYSPAATLPLTEESPLLPGSPYAISKMAQENLASYYGSLGFECIIARPFNHIGPGQGPGFIVPDLALQIKQAMQNNLDTISVGNLSAKRDYTDVRDIVRAYRLLIEKGEAGKVYNVCSGRSVSGEELLDGLMEAAGIRLKPVVEQAKLRPIDNPDIYGSYQKLAQATGWRPEIKLVQTLRDVIASI